MFEGLQQRRKETFRAALHQDSVQRQTESEYRLKEALTRDRERREGVRRAQEQAERRERQESAVRAERSRAEEARSRSVSEQHRLHSEQMEGLGLNQYQSHRFLK